MKKKNCYLGPRGPFNGPGGDDGREGVLGKGPGGPGGDLGIDLSGDVWVATPAEEGRNG